MEVHVLFNRNNRDQGPYNAIRMGRLYSLSPKFEGETIPPNSPMSSLTSILGRLWGQTPTIRSVDGMLALLSHPQTSVVCRKILILTQYFTEHGLR